MRNFREYDIWKNGISIVKRVYQITRDLPQLGKNGLMQQLQRAAVSIPSNIAEGSARVTEKEFSHYLRIAEGSAFEVETQLILAVELEFISQETLRPLLDDLHQLQRQIHHLIQKLSKKPKD